MATQLTNSAYKVKAGSVATTTGLNLEAGAIVFDESTQTLKVSDGVSWHEIAAIPYNNTYWVDILGPLTGNRLDSNSTNYEFDFFNAAMRFDNNARYPNEIISMEVQIQHYWKLETAAKPHLHWKQQSANIPNWLLGYNIDKNGQAGVIETDFSNYTFAELASHAFTYTSGVLNQISLFPDIDLTGCGISDLIHVVLFRDTANASGVFAGADPSSLAEYASDLDMHIQVDAPGSDQEYVKF